MVAARLANRRARAAHRGRQIAEEGVEAAPIFLKETEEWAGQESSSSPFLLCSRRPCLHPCRHHCRLQYRHRRRLFRRIPFLRRILLRPCLTLLVLLLSLRLCSPHLRPPRPPAPVPASLAPRALQGRHPRRRQYHLSHLRPGGNSPPPPSVMQASPPPVLTPQLTAPPASAPSPPPYFLASPPASFFSPPGLVPSAPPGGFRPPPPLPFGTSSSVSPGPQQPLPFNTPPHISSALPPSPRVFRPSPPSFPSPLLLVVPFTRNPGFIAGIVVLGLLALALLCCLALWFHRRDPKDSNVSLTDEEVIEQLRARGLVRQQERDWRALPSYPLPQTRVWQLEQQYERPHPQETTVRGGLSSAGEWTDGFAVSSTLTTVSIP